MPIFGTKDHFAIQLERKDKDTYFLNIWCNKRSVGDAKQREDIDLERTVEKMTLFIEEANLRRIKNSHTLSKEILFYVLSDSKRLGYYKLMPKKIRSKKNIREKKWIKLVNTQKPPFLDLSGTFELFRLDGITYLGAFDRKIVLLLNEPEHNRQRLMWRDVDTLALYEEFIPHKPFVEDIMRDCLEYIEKNNFLLEGWWAEEDNEYEDEF